MSLIISAFGIPFSLSEAPITYSVFCETMMAGTRIRCYHVSVKIWCNSAKRRLDAS
jgi:hypothetical protein